MTEIDKINEGDSTHSSANVNPLAADAAAVLSNPYPQYSWFLPVWEKYGNKPEHKDFFSKMRLLVEDNKVTLMV